MLDEYMSCGENNNPIGNSHIPNYIKSGPIDEQIVVRRVYLM